MCYSTYLHVYNSTVQVGEMVSIGQLVGHSGNNGTANTPHLHMELRCPTSGSTSAKHPFAYLPYAVPNSSVAVELLSVSVLTAAEGDLVTLSVHVSQDARALDLVRVAAVFMDGSGADLAGSSLDIVDFEDWIANSVGDTPSVGNVQISPFAFNAASAKAEKLS